MIIKIFFFGFLFIGSLNYCQNVEDSWVNQINEKLLNEVYLETGIKYKVQICIDVNKEVGLVAPLSQFTQYGIDDPYKSLKDCIMFLAIPIDHYNEVNITGIFKDGEIIWYSNTPMYGKIGEFVAYEDLNLDGKVDIITSWDDTNTTNIWIFSWDGVAGACINEKNTDGDYLPLSMKTLKILLCDIDGDGVEEILSDEENEYPSIWKWNGSFFKENYIKIESGFFIPAKSAKATINATISKEDSFFQYHYLIQNDENSKRRIADIYIDSELYDSTGSAPSGWRFSPIKMGDLVGWNWQMGNKNYLISPGKIINGFFVASTGIPKIGECYVQSERAIPYFGDIDEIPFFEKLINDIKENSFKLFTIVPGKHDLPINTSNFLDTLVSFCINSLRYNWIKNLVTFDKYISYFDSAKAKSLQNNYSDLENILKTVFQEVDTDSSVNLTSEAYALIKYNTEYLLKNLPEDQGNNFNIKLLNSQGTLLTGGNLQYYEGSWKDAINNGDGTFLVNSSLPKVSLRMTYEHGSQTLSNISLGDSIAVFQTVSTQVKLLNSQGSPIDTGKVQYYAGAWRDFSFTNNGTAVKELLPGNYSFRMTYAYSSNDRQQNIGINPVVVFSTINTTIELRNSTGSLIDQGTVQYYAGAWREIGLTSNGIIKKELLPNNYSFRMTHNYISNDKQQNMGTNSTVTFSTVLCTVKVTRQNQPVNNADIKYYAGAWRQFGLTANGEAVKELLPANLSFRAAYGGTSQDKVQNIALNKLVEFLLP